MAQDTNNHLKLTDDVPLDADPFSLFDEWFAEAKVHEPNDPNAMAVASVDQDGLPNVRMVLLKGLDAKDTAPRGFVFYTNFEGTKGREILANPKVALLFHWKSLGWQVRIRGPVSVVSDQEADEYFASRPRLSQIGAWASAQSRPLKERAELEASVEKFNGQFATGSVPRPPNWSGLRVVPSAIEFWKSKPFRLHDRVLYRRSATAEGWTASRLYP